MTIASAEIERICPECEHVMTLVHKGQFSTQHVCPNCGCTLTIPPRRPAVPLRTPSD